MHTYRPGNLWDEIPKEGYFGPPRAVTPWKKKKIVNHSAKSSNSGNIMVIWPKVILMVSHSLIVMPNIQH
jgi:hypothetical protein